MNKSYNFSLFSMIFWHRSMPSLLHHGLKFQAIWFNTAWDISSFMLGTYKKSPCIFHVIKYTKNLTKKIMTTNEIESSNDILLKNVEVKQFFLSWKLKVIMRPGKLEELTKGMTFEPCQEVDANVVEDVSYINFWI